MKAHYWRIIKKKMVEMGKKRILAPVRAEQRLWWERRGEER